MLHCEIEQIVGFGRVRNGCFVGNDGALATISGTDGPDAGVL